MPVSQPDCITCGACCFGGHDRYVRLFPEDHARPIPPAALTESDGTRFMRMQDGHCAQLCRGPGDTALCRIYEDRPTACRAFRAGSFECNVTRRDKMQLAEVFRAGGPPERPEPPHPVLPRVA
ncbi:YkgJ family cysteine cluster protein [Limimaricola sp.]|uniref:YkgJ family cysteine cluster protein n=1 Tax=Limimaricola sp. TaxID=2211665 RepID=UPI0025BFE08F|nr:YkgJ family cysteine cluster protein [Limimaricola sp.]